MLYEEDKNGIDPMSQLASEMAEPLGLGESIEVDIGVINNAYSRLNEGRGETTMSIHEKCGALIGLLKSQYSINAEYSLLSGKVLFVPIR